MEDPYLHNSISAKVSHFQTQTNLVEFYNVETEKNKIGRYLLYITKHLFFLCLLHVREDAHYAEHCSVYPQGLVISDLLFKSKPTAITFIHIHCQSSFTIRRWSVRTACGHVTIHQTPISVCYGSNSAA